jgi:N-acetylglucosamine kinase-like BadF-type ATPase
VAPLVFQVAQQGDPVAAKLLAWAGNELGELAKAVRDSNRWRILRGNTPAVKRLLRLYSEQAPCTMTLYFWEV